MLTFETSVETSALIEPHSSLLGRC